MKVRLRWRGGAIVDDDLSMGWIDLQIMDEAESNPSIVTITPATQFDLTRSNCIKFI